MPARFGGWLVDLWTFGAPRADAILFAAAFAPLSAEDWRNSWRRTRSRSRSPNSAERRLETTAQGAAFVARRARRLGLRAFASAVPPDGARRLSGRGRRGSSGSRSAARGEPPGLRSRPGRNRRLRRRAPRADRPDGRPEDPGDAPAAHTRAMRARRRAASLPISAPARSAPTSPPCVTRRNIRDCSGHDA